MIECVEDDSCTHMLLFSEGDKTEHNTMWLNYSDFGSCVCTRVVAPNVAQLDVFCDNTDACFGIELEATFAGDVELVCTSS